MTKIKKRNYLGLGIVLGIVTLLVSMMFLTFSYASENVDEQNEEQQTNDSLTVKFCLDGEFDERVCTFEAGIGELPVTWDGNILTLPAGASNCSLQLDKQASNKLNVNYTLEEKDYLVAVSAFTKDSSYIFLQYKYNPGPFVDHQVVNAIFKKAELPEYSSVTISGKVQTKEKNEALSGADVSLGNEKTGEVYATTHSDVSGNYQLTGLDDSLFKDESKLSELIVMASYPNKAIYSTSPGTPTEAKGGIGYITDNISLVDADISILGADFHKTFVISLEVYSSDGKVEDKSSKWTVENVGFPTDQIPQGATFKIDENGVFNGRANQTPDGSVYALITCKPVGQDGYSFDYCEMSGTKYYRGDSFEFAKGATGLTGVVHYTDTNSGSGQIAKTGDALPYAVVIGLGLVAAIAFAVARKQYN